MKKIDLIVHAPHFYTMEGKGTGYKTGISMAVDAGKIIALENSSEIENMYIAERRINLSHHAIFPGLIDAHMHTSLCILRGLAQDTNYWMMYGLQPFTRNIPEEARNAGSRLAIIEAVRNGTTTFGDFDTNADFVCDFLYRIGARGNIAYTIREAKHRVYHQGELYEFDGDAGEISLTKNLDLYDKWHNKDNGRIKILFGPQGADFVSKEMLLRIQKIARERSTKIHMHVQQGDRETYQIQKRYDKKPTAWLQEIGFLDSTLIAVHLTDASDAEAEIIAKSGASMILCPGSIGIIDGIVPPSVAFQKSGGYVALGSDQAPGNNCHNIIQEMKNAALFNKIKYQNPEIMPAWRAIRMATIEGAKAIGIGDITGSLEVGKQADFIAIDLMKPAMQPVFTSPMRNIIPNLVYSAKGDEVCLSAVAGKIIYENGRITNIDEDIELCGINEFTESIGHLAEKEFWEINGTNAHFMREEKL